MLLDAIMSSGQSSRLYQSMVYEQQLAAEVGSNFDVNDHPGVYALFAILSEGKTADEGARLAQGRDREDARQPGHRRPNSTKPATN